ncbi:hypothetical protein WMY93_033429, partial [Mugilogobius chulae]
VAFRDSSDSSLCPQVWRSGTVLTCVFVSGVAFRDSSDLCVCPQVWRSGTVLLTRVFVLRCGVQGQSDRRVLALELDRENRGLFVAFRSCVIRVAVSRCELHRGCQRSCLASQDPYCIWLRTGRCENFSPGFK